MQISLNDVFYSRAPANTMILGEHSVVYGQPAIACGLNQWLEIEWRPIQTPHIEIESALGSIRTPLHDIQIDNNLKFVCHALKAYQKQLAAKQQGWRLLVKSEFSSTIGLGSSAAVLAACLVGLNHICQTKHSLTHLWQIGKQLIIEIQGRGSATDLAASLYGGMVFFQPPTSTKPLTIESINQPLQIALVYSGYKTPTAQVLAQVAQTWQGNRHKLNEIYHNMGQITLHAYQALFENRLSEFFLCVAQYQTLMRELDVSDQTLDKLIGLLNQCPNIQAAKISGSGLGDCVLGIGKMQENDVPDKISSQEHLMNHCPNKTKLDEYLQIQLPISSKGAYLLTPNTEQEAPNAP